MNKTFYLLLLLFTKKGWDGVIDDIYRVKVVNARDSTGSDPTWRRTKIWPWLMSRLDNEHVDRNNNNDDDDNNNDKGDNGNNDVDGRGSSVGLSPEMVEVGQFMADFFRNIPKERYSFLAEKVDPSTYFLS